MQWVGSYVNNLEDIGRDNESLTEESRQFSYVEDARLSGADNHRFYSSVVDAAVEVGKNLSLVPT